MKRFFAIFAREFCTRILHNKNSLILPYYNKSGGKFQKIRIKRIEISLPVQELRPPKFLVERAPFNCGRWLKLLRGGCSPHLKMLVFRAYIYIFGLLPCSEEHMLVLFEHGKSPKIYMYTLKTASALALKMGSIPETLPPTPIKGGALRGGLFEQGKSPKIYMYTFKTGYLEVNCR